jgi:hypothetical protein
MQLHLHLQQLFQAPETLEVEINPQTGASEKILPGACLVCQSDMKLSYWGSLGCSFNPRHCWVNVTGDTLILRPLGQTLFHVLINYRTQRTIIGLWELENPALRTTELLRLEEALLPDEVTEENLRTWVRFS